MYELTDHRGNVMATVSDKKKGMDENQDGVIEYYNADVVSASDYYPFGMLEPGRYFSAGDKYRYGYNGKENDNEVKGEGNQQDYGMRVYDPRVGRFLSVDPITVQYPELTPYQFASNRTIEGIDMDGLEFAKKPNPKAKALLITSEASKESFRGMYKAAIHNRNIDVLIVKRLNDVTKYLKDVNTQYENILYADHGSGYQGSGQMIGDFVYKESDIIKYSETIEKISKNIKEDGKVILLGCFCAATQTNGTNYIRDFSAAANRKVIADQGETGLGPNLFNWEPLGVKPKEVRSGEIAPIWLQIAKENAGKWSEATPDGNVKIDIGNVRLDNNGAPHTKPYTPPLKADNKPLPTWQEIMQ